MHPGPVYNLKRNNRPARPKALAAASFRAKFGGRENVIKTGLTYTYYTHAVAKMFLLQHLSPGRNLVVFFRKLKQIKALRLFLPFPWSFLPSLVMRDR